MNQTCSPRSGFASFTGMGLALIPLMALAALSLACRSSETPQQAPAATSAAHDHAHGEGDHSHGEGDHSHGGAEHAHGDHSPKHGGVFFMAANNFHHLEGTMPEPGLFRLHLYDDHTKPVPVAGSAAAVRRSNEAEGTRHEMTPETDGVSWSVRLDPAPEMPVHLVATLTLTDPASGTTADHRFDFHFKTITDLHVAPGETHAHSSPHGGQVVTVGEDLHFELAEMGGVFALYVLDVNLEPLPLTSMEASLTVQRPDGSSQDVPLAAMGNHFMASSAVENTEGATVLADVKTEGRSRIGRFTLAAAPAP